MPLGDWIAAGARIEGGSPAAPAWSRAALSQHVGAYAHALVRCLPPQSVVGVMADNGPDWIAIDLAAQATRMTLVALPAFFTRGQIEHAVRASRMRALFCADAGHAAAYGFAHRVSRRHGLSLFRAPAGVRRESCASGAHKITFTSGTTGEPRGVVLPLGQQLATARALASVLAPVGITRHLCALPLPVLLENVAGVYTALALGARAICPPLAAVGLSGATGFDAQVLLEAIARHRPESLILLPQMLQGLVAAARAADPRIRSLRFVAVGGARTPPALILRARELGLPVYEGYGLTECASVVSVNLPGADRVGTVGRPLPGVSVRAASGGELEVAGRAGAGYLDAPAAPHDGWLATGDLGAIDADGYVTITGRLKNVLVTSFGRNVSPEWPESLLAESPLIAQAAVFGEAAPALVAVLVPASPQVDDAALGAAVAAANARLPDYARIGDWVRAAAPFAAGNGLATPNGRLRREAIASRHAPQLARAYEGMKTPS